MSVTRENHYVPQWYQEGFFEPGQNKLAYLDLAPARHVLADGRIVTEKSRFKAPTSRAFRQTDLYSTFFGTSVNDEIERMLFGDIDTRGAHAIRAFCGDDVSEWHRHFTTLFEFLDIQKIRTPKGLDWLRSQYPELTQNDLMMEMQGIRTMHCSIWAEGVREIVSAVDADVKFIISDHPVTIYNHALPPDEKANAYPREPSIALKGTQTIFPLNRNYCLILTNLEYAENPAAKAVEKRTFAGNFRSSMVRTDAFIRTRQLTNDEVIRVNRAVKTRAKRFLAAGREEWLYPEQHSAEAWSEMRSVFLPPKRELWHFGGEMYAKFDSGEVRYQDAFGRTEKERDYLKKTDGPKGPKDACGCGSGREFRHCCLNKKIELRPSWAERSIRERNLIFCNGLVKILGLDQGKDWVEVRRDLSDAKIREVYELHDALWPLETNLLALLPKPDGTPRALYTGLLHPSALPEFAFGTTLYFDEVLVQNPFVHPRTVKKEFSPTENPRSYRQEFLKSAVLLLEMLPLIERGLVNLFPDPCDFDFHLRDQMMRMAERRGEGLTYKPGDDPRLEHLQQEDANRGMLLFPDDMLRRQIRLASPNIDADELEAAVKGLKLSRESDPLAVLQDGSMTGGPGGGQFTMMKLAPNFELSMYLAQATGSAIVTDSPLRWREFGAAAQRRRPTSSYVAKLRDELPQRKFSLLQDPNQICSASDLGLLSQYPVFFRRLLAYIVSRSQLAPKPNVEEGLSAEFSRVYSSTQALIEKVKPVVSDAKLTFLCPHGGIVDNTVNRLLLMSSSEHHLPSVPLVIHVEAFPARSAPS